MSKGKPTAEEMDDYTVNVRGDLKRRLKMYAASLGISVSRATSDLLDKNVPHYAPASKETFASQT
jgi:thiol:disulfide interchange protein